MAFVVGAEEEEDIEQIQTPGPVGGGTISAPAAPAPAAAPKGSGAFTNIQQYIEANRPKTQEISQQITKGLESEAEQFRTGVQQQRQQALGVGSQLGQEQQRLAGGEQFVTGQLEQAGKAPITEQQQESFRKIREAVGPGYQAPTFREESRQAQELQQRGEQFQTAKGRQEELARTFAARSPSYAGGQRALDALLLGGDKPVARTTAQRAREATRGLGEQVGTLTSDIGATLQEQQARRAALQEFAKRQLQFGTEAEGLEAQLSQRGYEDILQQKQQQMAAAEAARTQARQAFTEAGPGGYSAEQIQALGIDPTQALFGIDPTQYMAAAPKYQLGQFTSPEEAARYQALRQLGGVTGGQPLEAIGGGVSPLQFQQEALQAELGKRQTAFEEELAPQIERYKQAQQLREGIRGIDVQKAFAPIGAHEQLRSGSGLVQVPGGRLIDVLTSAGVDPTRLASYAGPQLGSRLFGSEQQLQDLLNQAAGAAGTREQQITEQVRQLAQQRGALTQAGRQGDFSDIMRQYFDPAYATPLMGPTG